MSDIETFPSTGNRAIFVHQSSGKPDVCLTNKKYMKKLFLSLALLGGVVFSSQAQTEKGKFIVGGNVSYNTTKSDLDGAKASHEFSIVPNIGYFVNDNIAI